MGYFESTSGRITPERLARVLGMSHQRLSQLIAEGRGPELHDYASGRIRYAHIPDAVAWAEARLAAPIWGFKGGKKRKAAHVRGLRVLKQEAALADLYRKRLERQFKGEAAA
jgi:hypothetical protein